MPFLDNDGVTRLTTDYLDVFARKQDAILDPSGGLTRTDDGISVDSLIRESDGAISGSIVELTAEGHAEQFSTTGKNLLQNDGYFPVSGTFNSSYYKEFTFNASTLPRIEVQAGVTYTLSLDVESSVEPFTIAVGLGNGTYTYTAADISNLTSGRKSITFTLTEEQIAQYGNILAFRAPRYIGSAQAFTYSVTNVQLELGSTATEYEPYTGGVPSPSPDYPQEIQVVRGRNLLDESGYFPKNASITAYYVAFTVNSGTIPRIELEEGVTYTLSFDVESSVDNFIASVGAGNGSYSTDLFYKVNNQNGRFSATFTPTAAQLANGNILAIFAPRYSASTTFSYKISNVQLELGSTPTPYVPYGHVGMEAQGKNLLPMMQPTTISGITATVADDGTITLNGTATATTFFYCQCNIAPGTYTLSANNPTAMSAGTVVFKLVDAAIADIPGGSKQINDAYSVIGITIQATASNYVIRIAGGSTLSNYTMRLQLEPGSTATEYEPYYHTTTPIPLPQRGWVAGLLDGTSDILTLDGAGRWEWNSETGMFSIADASGQIFGGSTGDSGWGGANTCGFYIYPNRFAERMGNEPTGINVRCSHLLSKYPIYNVDGQRIATNANAAVPVASRYVSFRVPRTLLSAYGSTNASEAENVAAFLAWGTAANVRTLYRIEPFTESGYIDLPSIEGDCTISIPELDALGVKYFMDDSAGTLARQWYERVQSEYADRITALEQAVAELATS